MAATRPRPSAVLRVSFSQAPVRYRGVDVGKVDEIAIDSANSGRVRIRIGVKEGTPITTST